MYVCIYMRFFPDRFNRQHRVFGRPDARFVIHVGLPNSTPTSSIGAARGFFGSSG